MRAKPELLIVKLVCKTKSEHMNMLYDSGSTISLIKLKYLKDDTSIKRDILEIDFLRKYPIKYDFQKAELRIRNVAMKLRPFSKVILKPSQRNDNKSCNQSKSRRYSPC